MKRKICGALAFMLLLFSCLGALAEDLQFDSSREVADYLEQAGKKFAQKEGTSSYDILVMNYTPNNSTMLERVSVTLNLFETSAAIVGNSIPDIDISDMLALYQTLENMNDSISFIRFVYDAANNCVYSRVDIPYVENANFGQMVERYAYITTLLVDQHYDELAVLKK